MNKKARLNKNNKGSGLVSVIVAISFLTILGSMLLIANYTLLTMKANEQQGKENYYDATTVMEEVRATMQGVTSDALKSAYSEAMPRYSQIGTEVKGVFGTKFQSSVLSWKNGGSSLFSGMSFPYKLNTATLIEMISDKRGIGENGEITITCGDVTQGTDADSIYNVILNDLVVTYNNNGRITSLACSIELSCPDIVYALTHYTISGLPEFITVANNNLNVSMAKSVTASGSIYAKNINMANASSLTVNSGTVICKEKFLLNNATNTSNRSVLTVNAGSGIWADTIEVGSYDAVSLLGKSFLANDLMLQGQGASATLGGDFFGFGSSSTNSLRSSSIIVNAENTSLDLRQLSSLSLSGVCFIGGNQDDIVNGASSAMGESVSAKANENAYLIPANLVRVSGAVANSNPEIKDSAVTADDTSFNAAGTLVPWEDKVRGEKRYYAGYGIKSTPKVINRNVAGGKKAVYFFFDFETTEDRNEYFRDYFTYMGTDIDSYVSVNSGVQTIYKTLGNAYTGTGLVNPSTDALALSAYSYNRQFTSMCSDLTTNLAFSGLDNDALYAKRDSENLYNNIVDTTKLNAQSGNGTLQFKNEAGETVGIVVCGNYTVDNSAVNSKVCIVLASGNVTVDADFSGVIISGGNIILNADNISLNCDGGEVIKAYSAMISDTQKVVDSSGNRVQVPLSYFFTDYVVTNGGGSTSADAWNIDDLVIVSYQRKK